MNKKFFKSLLAGIMALSVSLNCFSLDIQANDNVSETLTTTTYTNEIPDFNAASFEKLTSGYELANTNGNNHAVSSISAKQFEMSATISFMDNVQNKTSFVFGAESNNWNDLAGSTKFWAVEFWKDSSANALKIKLFHEHGLGNYIIPYTVAMSNIGDKTSFNVKVSYDENDKLHIWVEDNEVNYSFNTASGKTEVDFLANYTGGYFGLLSYKTNVKYENFVLKTKGNTYENDLPGFNGNGTNVQDLENGYQIKKTNGNNFATTSVYTDEFTIEMTANITEGSRFSLLFGAPHVNYAATSTARKFYGLEFMISNGNLVSKIFKEGVNSNYKSNIQVASGVALNTEMKIKVTYDRSVGLIITVNEENPVTIENSVFAAENYTGGYLGFLTWKSSVTLTDIKVSEADLIYKNELSEMNGKKITSLTSGYKLHDNSGNNHGTSNVQATEFTLETTATINESTGDRFSVVFGSQTNDYTKLKDATNRFFGLEFKKSGTDLYIALFQDGNGLRNYYYIKSAKVASVSSNEIKVKVSYTNTDGLRIWINGDEIIAGTDFNFETDKSLQEDYKGGYIGFLSYTTEVSFTDIVLTTVKENLNFNTNLTNLTGLEGTWKITEDGLYSNTSGDQFALSETTASNFIYEADVTFAQDASGAASLVFYANGHPKSGSSYILNVDKKNKVVKFFTFKNNGATILKQVSLSESKDSYHLQAVVVDGTIRFYVDGKLEIAMNVEGMPESGALGLLSYSTTCTYQNVYYKEITSEAMPSLTDLSITNIEGETGLTFTPVFNKDTISYDVTLPANVSQMNVSASSDADSISWEIVSATGVKSDQGTFTNGEVVTLTPPIGTSTMTITLTKGDISSSYLVNITSKTGALDMANEAYRNQVHFSPEVNFMNDPNGLVYDVSNDTWHMFYQYSPQLHGMGNQTWGHAVSTDLVNWVELPVAIPKENLGNIYSGSAVSLTVEEARKVSYFSEEDIENYKEGNGSLLVAIYTTTGPQQDQSVAFSTDHGVTWDQYDGNPVVKHEYTSDRDPKVFKVEGDDRFYMIVAGGYARLYVTEDFIHWEKVQDLTWKDGSLINSECPDMYPLSVLDKDGNDSGEVKWVYNAASEWYVFGDMVWNEEVQAYNFVAETGKVSAQTGGNSNAYAAQSYYNDPVSNRRITVHWIRDYSTTNGIDKRWNGVQSLPLETTLKYIDGSYLICQNPVKEVETLRGNKLYDSIESKVTSVNESDSNILNGLTAQVYEVVGTFDMEDTTATEFGFELRMGDGEKVIYKYDVKSNTMILDKSMMNVSYEAQKLSWSLTPTSDHKIQLRAIVDQSVIETFGNEGEAHLIDLYYPSQEAVGMSFYAKGGSVAIDDLKVYELKSIYTQKEVSETYKTTYISLASDSFVEMGEEFTVTANVYPMTSVGEITWDIPEGIQIVSKTSNSITLQGNTEGTYTIKASVNGKEVETSVSVAKKEFNTNLTGWNAVSGDWEVSFNGMLGANSADGDRYYVSNASLPTNVSWTYEADILIESGQAGGLLFGVKDPTNPKSHWMCINSDLGTNNNFFKFFKITGNNDWNFTTPHGVMANENTFHICLEYDATKALFTFKVAPYGTTDYVVSNTKEDVSFAQLEGNYYFGLVTYKSNTSFNNVILTVKEATITSIDAQEKIEIDTTMTIEELEALLPTSVTGTKSDGNTYRFDVDAYDLSNVDVSKAGTYTIQGSVEDTTFEIEVVVKQVVDQVEKVEDVKVKENSTLEELLEQLPTTITVVYTDGTSAEIRVNSDMWDLDALDLTTAGTYTIQGLAKEGTQFAMNVVVESVTASQPSKTPETGDTTNTAGLLTLLLASAYVLSKKRKA